jgi:hypothetical protein
LPKQQSEGGKMPFLRSKAPFRKRFEEAEGHTCESAAASRMERQFGLAASTMQTIDQRHQMSWARTRREQALRLRRVGEIFLGWKQGSVTLASSLDAGEPLRFVIVCKKETLDEFFSDLLSAFQRGPVSAACADMWEPSTFRISTEECCQSTSLSTTRFPS